MHKLEDMRPVSYSALSLQMMCRLAPFFIFGVQARDAETHLPHPLPLAEEQ